jgi:hypothetical protein
VSSTSFASEQPRSIAEGKSRRPAQLLSFGDVSLAPLGAQPGPGAELASPLGLGVAMGVERASLPEPRGEPAAPRELGEERTAGASQACFPLAAGLQEDESPKKDGLQAA